MLVISFFFLNFHKDYVMELSLIIDSRMTGLFILYIYIRQLVINVIFVYICYLTLIFVDPGCYHLVKKSDVRLSDSTTINLNYTEM